ncbi:phage baseplate assembly protein [Methylobacterium sp. HMF5984]|uniref:phage baseplate assembly protein n=1 Tax=Methylobacterium sp. HMF5984 TaxID=3367370 RepID=UPI00385302FF
MPAPELFCEVRTAGGTYRNWMQVVIAQSFDAAWQRNFSLICAEPNAVANFRLKPGDRVDVTIAGQVVIREGYIVNREASYDANRHGVKVDGYSKAGVAAEGSVDSGTGQFRGYRLNAIANSVLKPYGIKFRLENPPEGANEPFPNVMVRYGESPFSLISRLCNMRGLWLRADADGTMVAGTKPDGTAATFVEGQNILAAACSIQMPAVSKTIYNSQQPGSDSLFGKKAAEIQAGSTLSGGIPGIVRKGLAEMPADAKGVQLRTNMDAQAIESSRLRVSLTYAGWLKPDGTLWSLTDKVSVKSPMLFPTESGQMELKLWGYVYSQNEAGTTTTIELVNAGAFAIRNPDAKADDGWYRPGATEAQPDAPT